MKALILNSGTGSRMGEKTKNAPKCMSEIAEDVTIFSNQVELLLKNGISEFVVTTGAHRDVLTDYAKTKFPNVDFKFVHNDEYSTTNYIYSIFLARKEVESDILLMHGDLVFEGDVVKKVLASEKSSMVIDSKQELPDKDFKAVINNGRIEKVGIEFFDNAVACQPLYKLNKVDWLKWLDAIIEFCNADNRKVYAENALNTVTDKVEILPIDIGESICMEVDTGEDLEKIREILK